MKSPMKQREQQMNSVNSVTYQEKSNGSETI
jgi:hypothetical protein